MSINQILSAYDDLIKFDRLYLDDIATDIDEKLTKSSTASSHRKDMVSAQEKYIKHLIDQEKYTNAQKPPEPPTPTDEPLTENPERIPPHWYTDIKAFAQEALNIALFDHQRELCQSTARVTVMVAGRGAGKSVAAKVKAIYQAVMHPKHTVIVVSSGQRMSTTFGEDLQDALNESTLRPHIKSLSKTQIDFHNGSVIRLLPANADTIRGYHPKKSNRQTGLSVILDEACFMEQGDEIRKAVEYMLITASQDRGKLFITTSPSTVGSWVHAYTQKAEDPKAQTRVIQCPSSANPNISAEEIERLKATKNDLEFRAEVLGEWVEGAFGLFQGIIEPNIIEDASIPDGAECFLGADLALSFNHQHDRNALAVIAKYWTSQADEPHYRVMDIQTLSQSSERELKSVVNRLIKQYTIQRAAVEQYQGKSLSEHCQTLAIETDLIAPTSARQQTIFHELHRLLRLGLLELPKHLNEIFFAELKSFEYRREQNGHISFGHPNTANQHDDTVYALAWALHAAQQSHCSTKLYTTTPIAFVPKW